MVSTDEPTEGGGVGSCSANLCPSSNHRKIAPASRSSGTPTWFGRKPRGLEASNGGEIEAGIAFTYAPSLRFFQSAGLCALASSLHQPSSQ